MRSLIFVSLLIVSITLSLIIPLRSFANMPGEPGYVPPPKTSACVNGGQADEWWSPSNGLVLTCDDDDPTAQKVEQSCTNLGATCQNTLPQISKQTIKQKVEQSCTNFDTKCQKTIKQGTKQRIKQKAEQSCTNLGATCQNTLPQQANVTP